MPIGATVSCKNFQNFGITLKSTYSHTCITPISNPEKSNISRSNSRCSRTLCMKKSDHPRMQQKKILPFTDTKCHSLKAAGVNKPFNGFQSCKIFGVIFCFVVDSVIGGGNLLHIFFGFWILKMLYWTSIEILIFWTKNFCRSSILISKIFYTSGS